MPLDDPDALTGVAEISAYIKIKPRRTSDLLQAGLLPGFKWTPAGEWHSTKSSLDRHFSELAVIQTAERRAAHEQAKQPKPGARKRGRPKGSRNKPKLTPSQAPALAAPAE